MKKQPIIKVPKGIRYLSEWKEFALPDFPCILDKQIAGCGFTEYCISSPENVILCSPRKLLLKNKEEQHPNDVFYIKNEFEAERTVDKDLERLTKRQASIGVSSLRSIVKEQRLCEEKKKIKAAEILSLKQQIKDYIYYCNGNGKSIKLLVTYDSFKLVKEALIDINFLDKFRVVIDEFQSIFTDSKFKSNTELEFLNHLQGISKLSFVSATPMIDDYLEELDEFKDLPYFELDWSANDPGRILVPDFSTAPCRSINEPAYEIIQKYLNNEFEVAVYRDENDKVQFKYSKEAVFYVNSVNNIIGIVKKCGLTPEQCNIIIADTAENRKKLNSKLGKEWTLGTPPLKGAEHKMFTFCTRTVYLGADFYSTCARTFILSDANIDTLSVDIELDLPQILGRQRNLENPWKNRAEFYYKTSRNNLPEDVVNDIISQKVEKSMSLLKAYEQTTEKQTLAEKYQSDTINMNYKFDYISVNEHAGSTLIPCFNKLVMLAEKRSFELQSKFYGDRAAVINSIYSLGLVKRDNIDNFLTKFNKEYLFRDKLRLLCESSNDLSASELSVVLEQIPLSYKNFYIGLGPERCRAVSYCRSDLEKELSINKFDKTDLKRELDFIFKIGEVYALSEIKEKLGTLYNTLEYKKTPKANDLLEYYEVKDCMKSMNKKRIACYKIIKKL